MQDDPGTVELRADLPTLPARERHILVHDADRRRRVGSAVRLRPLVAQTAHPRCPWVTPPVAVYDPNSFEDGALGPLESDAERGMERGEREPRNALRCVCVNDLQDIHIGNRFRHVRDLERMPRVKLIGNIVLTVVTKLVSGYWRIFDVQNGFTAISREALESLPLDRLDRG